MSNTQIPEEINFNPKTRVLELGYPDGSKFKLPCEYLRVYSPSVEVSGMGELAVYKEGVTITDIQPMGNYAVRIYFDDGHKSGIYSWEHLYDLAINQEQHWQDYLQRLAAAGYKRKEIQDAKS
jgi:DUF971 family protein